MPSKYPDSVTPLPMAACHIGRRRLLQGTWGLLSGVGALAGLSACGGAEDADTAYLRLVNATVDFSLATLKVDGDTAFASVAYGGTPTDYVKIASGSRSLVLSGTSGTSGPSAAFSFTTDTDSTVIAYGTLSAGMTLKRLDETTATPATGTLSLRLFHAAPLLGGLDLYITNTSSLAGLTPQASVSTLGELSSFAALDEGSYRVRLTARGDHASVLFDSGSTTSSRIAFAGQVVVTLVAVPRSSGSLPDLTALPEKLAAGVLSNGLA